MFLQVSLRRLKRAGKMWHDDLRWSQKIFLWVYNLLFVGILVGWNNFYQTILVTESIEENSTVFTECQNTTHKKYLITFEVIYETKASNISLFYMGLKKENALASSKKL